MNEKGLIVLKFLRFIGLLKEIPISKSEMCKQAQDVCNHNCDSCAWADREEGGTESQ